MRQAAAGDQGPVAVLLTIQDASVFAADPMTGGITQAADLRPNGCVVDGAAVRDAVAAAAAAAGPNGTAPDAPVVCGDLEYSVATSSSRVNLVLSVNAILDTLPEGVLVASNGATVGGDTAPFVKGAVSSFNMYVEIPTTGSSTIIEVPAGALNEALGRPSAASNSIKATWDTAGPKVSSFASH